MTEEQRRLTPADFMDEGQSLGSSNFALGDMVEIHVTEAMVVDVTGPGLTAAWRDGDKVLEVWVSPGTSVYRA